MDPNKSNSNNTGSGQPMPSGSSSAGGDQSSAAVPVLFKRRKIQDPYVYNVFRELRIPNRIIEADRVRAWTIQPDDPNFLRIHQYIRHGQGHGYGIKILTILGIQLKAHQPISPSVNGVRKMLWYGATQSSIRTIMDQGIQPAKKDRWLMFGHGIYFTDIASNCCQYSSIWRRDDGGIHECKTLRGWIPAEKHYCILCDVHVGDPFPVVQGVRKVVATPVNPTTGLNYDSVICHGKSIPDLEGDLQVDGSTWPLGKAVPNSSIPGLFVTNFNEYCVYNNKQVEPKFLVQVELTPFPVYERIS